MNSAILGGTFNPIHIGHLRVAEEVREALGLDKVVFVPTFLTPHKANELAVPGQTRLEMVQEAIKDNPGFVASDVEIKRGGKSFTIDTVRELTGEGMEVSLIIGNDSFNDIVTWCEYEEILSLANIIIVHRPGYAVKKPGEVLPVELARKFWYDSEADAYLSTFGKRISYVGTTLLDISSSDLRRRVNEGLSIRYLVPDTVGEFIKRHGLYR